MIIVSIATIILFIILYKHCDRKDSWGEIIFTICIFTITESIITIMLILIPTSFVKSLDYHTGYQDEYYDIVSIKNKSDVSGQFSGFLLGFSGGIDSVERYYFYIKANRGLLLGKVSAENTFIVETNSQSPKWLTRKFYIINNLFYIFWFSNKITTCYREEYLIVPTNTVKVKFLIE